MHDVAAFGCPSGLSCRGCICVGRAKDNVVFEYMHGHKSNTFKIHVQILPYLLIMQVHDMMQVTCCAGTQFSSWVHMYTSYHKRDN